MLDFIVISVFLYPLYSYNQMPLVFLSFLCLFLSSSIPLSCNSSVATEYFILDENVFYLSLISILVTYISYLFSPSKFLSASASILFLLFCSLLIFSTNHIFLLYIYYEMSLLPILFIILNWGSYPDRSVSSAIILSFTAILAIPFISAIFSFHLVNETPSLLHTVTLFPFTTTASFIVILTFCVKLPIYGLHFWLPIAHVEAPTFGSILLAGILLNLGGIGLIRLLPFISFASLFNILSYSVLFLSFVTLICCFQSDFNRLIAFSSVSHIITLPLLFIAANPISISSALIIIYFHGLSSPILFSLVGTVYSLTSTRLLFLLRGILLLSPLLTFLSTLLLFFTISTPPIPSFIPEVMFFFSTISVSYYSIVSLFVFAFLSIVYSLSWYVPLNYQSVSFVNNSYTFTFEHFLSFFLAFILTFISLLLLSFV